MDMLDATTPSAEVAGAGVNGPPDDASDWLAIDWCQVEDSVRRLRQRIFTASKAGDLKKVRNLQKLMLRSHANAVLSVRRVTEINAGRMTAGVDGRLALGPEDKAALADWTQRPGRGHPGRSNGCTSARPTANVARSAYR
jgi:RNA-directed DNA polymerase